MKLDVVDYDDRTRTQAGQQHMFDVQIKDFGVEGTLNHHRCANPAQPQSADHGELAAGIKRFADDGTLPNGGAGVGAGHRQMDAKFVKKNQIFDLQLLLLLAERRSRLGVSFGGAFRLFFRERPSPCSPRQMVLALIWRRAFFFICCRSSSRVASGVRATSLANLARWSSVSFAVAPPACGKGAI